MPFSFKGVLIKQIRQHPFFGSFCPALQLPLRWPRGCGWLSTSSICVGALRAKEPAQNTGALSAQSWSAPPVSAPAVRAAELPQGRRPSRRSGSWRLLLSQPRQRDKEGFLLVTQGTRNAGSLPDCPPFLPLYRDRAGWGLGCFLSLLAWQKESCCCAGCQQMKMGRLRRMLPFFLMRITEILPWVGWWLPRCYSHNR